MNSIPDDGHTISYNYYLQSTMTVELTQARPNLVLKTSLACHDKLLCSKYSLLLSCNTSATGSCSYLPLLSDRDSSGRGSSGCGSRGWVIC